MPSTILKPATLSKDDPQIRKARFTPINCQSSITGYDSLSGGKIAVLHSDDENQSNLVEAKRLSQRAVKEALAPAPQPEAEYVDMRIMEGYQSSKKLSRKATELALAAADQADNDLSPLRAEVHQSAERCGKTKPPKSKSSRAARKTKGDKVKGRGTEISKQKPLKQISQDRSNNSNEERFTRNIKHPHLTSPTPVSSLGFVYRKVGSNSAELDQPLAAVKPKTLQRRRPRPMMFESSPTSPRTPVFREFRRMDEHIKNDKRFFKLNTTDNTTRCIGSDDLSQRSKIRPLEENKELVASTYDDAETFGEREAIVVEDNLAISSVASKTSTYQPCGQVSGPSIPDHQDPNAYSLSSRDLSTQAAMMMARRDFQEEFGSSIHEVDSLPDGFTNTPPAKANSTDVTAITPFHTFNTGSTNPVVNPNAHVEMPMSTQDLFNAASPFALSTAKKKWRRPSFTSLQAKTGEDFKVDGSGLKQHHSDKERRKARAVEDNDDGVEQLNTSQRGGQREDASSRPARSSTQSQLLASRSPLKERNIGTSFHNSSGSQPKPCRSQVATFSITPSGSLKEVSYQDGQRLLADIDLNAELDFAGSFLQSWDTESLIRK
ncbi:hypothetical protein AOQ84DRAFT_167270 [Glonium stellatum]|uniref:Uncharacterized protein n=1 Tax=Glonium stellatum TaxID=574774 RepID=A0A8E2JW99_9PEZI|nr:hypothetical protein AOQ84DRAFT_167270 [Glonium stellatum]